MKCECCNKEISGQQWRFSKLCGLCDTGKCQRPSEYHKLEEELKQHLKGA